MRLSGKFLRAALALVCAVKPLSAPVAAEIQLPEMGDVSSGIISVDEEQRIGAAFMRQLRFSLPVLDDAELNSYITSLGNRLASHSSDPGRRFTFFLVADSAINAFAGPGGYIGLHSGLIAAAETEAEMGSVLAHEVAHVTQRHLPRALEQANRLSLPTIAAVVGALILGAYNPQAGAAAVTAVQAGSIQAQIDFTRENEREADRVGMQGLVAAGLDPRAMPAFFERLQQATRLSISSDYPTFLRTHPVTLDRIADARDRAERIPPGNYRDSKQFPYFQAKVRALSGGRAEAVAEYFQSRLDGAKLAHPDAERYGLALAWMRAGRLDESRALLAKLRGNRQDFLPLLIAQMDLELAANDYPAALALGRKGLNLYPDNSALTPLMARALLRSNQAPAARTLLADHIRRKGGTPQAYDLLAEVLAADNDPVEAYQMRAEYHVATGRIETAIEQLRRAGKLQPITFYQLSRVEARLRQLEADLAFERKYFGPRRGPSGLGALSQ